MAQKRFIQVILPLKLEWEPFYSLPEGMTVEVGTRVRVVFANAFYTGCVSRVDAEPGMDPERIMAIEAVEDALPAASEHEIAFWRSLAQYYLCTVGEVYKVAYTALYNHQSRLKVPETGMPPQPALNVHDDARAAVIRHCWQQSPGTAGKTILLAGRTNRAVLVELAREVLEKGRSVLILEPETGRADATAAIPGALVYHSGVTAGKRKAIAERVRTGDPCLVIGTRSALFLPFRNLGLIAVEDEHDPAYKQDAPAPRYHARESAIMLASIHHAHVILTSPTPSLESIYNARCGRYIGLSGEEPAENSSPEVINISAEYRKNGMAGVFSLKLLKQMSDTLAAGQQVLLVAPRRIYEAGRKVEDNVLEYFPAARVANLDQGQPDDEYDIYIASTATTRGFRCGNLGLVGLVNWDGMLSRQDFRADERAFQLLEQFRSMSPRLMIQTREPHHPVFKAILSGDSPVDTLLAERSLVGYPPYARMVKVLVKDKNEKRLHFLAKELAAAVVELGIRVEGPLAASDEPACEIRLLLPRDKTLLEKKAALGKTVAAFEVSRKYTGHIVIDVDPV